MSRLGKSILGAALLAGLTATAAITPASTADARPHYGPHRHWVHGWHGSRYGWWWAGPRVRYWYPAPVYYGPPPRYFAYPAPAPWPVWYYPPPG
jgi:hypothetical protein